MTPSNQIDMLHSPHTASAEHLDSVLKQLSSMAEAIAEIMDKTGHCGTRDLRARGFSYDDIARYWPNACEMAETKRLKTLCSAK